MRKRCLDQVSRRGAAGGEGLLRSATWLVRRLAEAAAPAQPLLHRVLQLHESVERFKKLLSKSIQKEKKRLERNRKELDNNTGK